MQCADAIHSYKHQKCAKGLLDLNFDEAVIDRITVFPKKNKTKTKKASKFTSSVHKGLIFLLSTIGSVRPTVVGKFDGSDMNFFILTSFNTLKQHYGGYHDTKHFVLRLRHFNATKFWAEYFCNCLNIAYASFPKKKIEIGRVVFAQISIN